MYVSVHRGQKRASDCLRFKLQLWAAAYMAGMRPRSCGRAARGAISLVPCLLLITHTVHIAIDAYIRMDIGPFTGAWATYP